MTPRSSGPGGEYAPLRGTTNLRLTANQHCKCNGKLRWRSCGHHFPSQPGRGSATDCLGHSRKADLVNFSQAPKRRLAAAFQAVRLTTKMACRSFDDESRNSKR